MILEPGLMGCQLDPRDLGVTISKKNMKKKIRKEDVDTLGARIEFLK